MPNEDTLLSILSFAALVAPAIAVVMQVLENRGEQGSFQFTLLEVGLVTILSGTLILMIQLINKMENLLTILGSLLIFLSLSFAALAIGWSATSLSKKFAEATGASPDIWMVSKQAFYLSLVISIPALVYGVILYSFDVLVSEGFNIGPIKNIDTVTPTILLGIVLFLLFIRTMIYLVRVSAIPVSDLNTSMRDSFSISLGLSFGYLALGAAPIYLSRLVFFVPDSIIQISQNNPGFTLPYAWSMLVVLVLFASKLDDEEEAEEEIEEEDVTEVEENGMAEVQNID